MTEVFDRASRRRVAVLENAHNILEEQRINAVWQLRFSLPWDDSKNQFCKPFHYVRHDGGELYRIMPEALDVEETGTYTYQCEHVLATLIDHVLFGHHVVGNLGVYTENCIRYVLDHQLVRNWVLDQCDFRRQFEYGWEQESLLSALFSIANPLPGPYMWSTDTSHYPWRLSLKRLESGRPELYVRRRHNMRTFHRDRDPQQIVTRIYPKGYGEGVNQLGIESVNGGVPYLQSPQAVVDKYGLIERVWVDRRYEDPENLKAAAQAMLDELQEPAVSYEVGFQELSSADWDRAEVGRRVRVVFPELGEHVDTFVTQVNRDFGDITRSSIVVANKETSIASSLADMADRQRIEQTYAQGATQLYAQALQANCDSRKGAVMDFFIPAEMRIINKVLAKIRMGPFWAYSKSTQSQEARAAVTSYAGEQSSTSSSGGGSVNSTAGGGGVTTDTGKSGINVEYGVASTFEAAGHTHQYEEVQAHQHRITLYDHTHQVAMPAHQHSFSIPGHAHEVTVPGHAHDITPGIFEFGSPQSFALYVNGERRGKFEGQMAEVDLTAHLTEKDGRIPRGRWLSMEVRPNDLAYVSLDLIVQGFVQSRGDNTV